MDINIQHYYRIGCQYIHDVLIWVNSQREHLNIPLTNQLLHFIINPRFYLMEKKLKYDNLMSHNRKAWTTSFSTLIEQSKYTFPVFIVNPKYVPKMFLIGSGHLLLFAILNEIRKIPCSIELLIIQHVTW